MSVKTTQEAGEIWYNNSHSETYILIEQIDTHFWQKNKKETVRWKAFCLETGSHGPVHFNSDAPDYAVWEYLA